MTKTFYKVREIKDLRDMIYQSAELYAERPAFEIKAKDGSLSTISYKEYLADINALGTALADMGLTGQKIAVSGDNCYEWCLSYMATVLGIGVMQIVRIFGIPLGANKQIIEGTENVVMDHSQFTYVVIMLCLSAACCIAAGVIGLIRTHALEDHNKKIASGEVILEYK